MFYLLYGRQCTRTCCCCFGLRLSECSTAQPGKIRRRELLFSTDKTDKTWSLYFDIKTANHEIKCMYNFRPPSTAMTELLKGTSPIFMRLCVYNIEPFLGQNVVCTHGS